MKQLLTTLFLTVFALNALAQESQTTLYFQSVHGALDSVVIGHHPDATQGVDSLLGEAQSNEGWVFVHPSLIVGNYYSGYDSTINMKKQYIQDGRLKTSAFTIRFPEDSLPVTMSRDTYFCGDYNDSGNKHYAWISTGRNTPVFWSDAVVIGDGERHDDNRYDIYGDVSAPIRYFHNPTVLSAYNGGTPNVIYYAYSYVYSIDFMGLENVEEQNQVVVANRNNVLDVRAKDETIKQIFVYSINANVLQQRTVEDVQATVDMTSFPQGIYFLVIHTVNSTYHSKVIVK
ncbi:MAG: T9SS type A sorting domain-containing protein [Bacteroidales bacterium]|nr:T9SS type A sorting domain-containing protein [Bacteroidales bacterium]